MIRIAVVDDDAGFREQLVGFITRYFDDRTNLFSVSCYGNGVDFLTEYKCNFDLVILDIEMPMMNGMDVAQRLRGLDAEVKLIFITQTARLAIRGYEVSALDYILKPLDYDADFKHKFANVMKKLETNKTPAPSLLVSDNSGAVVRLDVKDLILVKKDRDDALFYTTHGVYRKRISLFKVEETLSSDLVATCSSGCLVNLSYVKNISGSTVSLTSGETIFMSRGKKQEFLRKFFSYING